MPFQLNEENGGRILAVHVSGKLAKVNYKYFAPAFERLVQQHGKLRVLFDLFKMNPKSSFAALPQGPLLVEISKLFLRGKDRSAR